MIRISLFITLSFVLAIHFLTPDWILTDFVVLGDWLVIGILFFNTLLAVFAKISISSRYTLLAIGLSIVFILTTIKRGEEISTVSFRISRILDFNVIPSNGAVNIVEIVNLISLVALLITELIIIVMVIKFILNDKNSGIKLRDNSGGSLL